MSQANQTVERSCFKTPKEDFLQALLYFQFFGGEKKQKK